MMSVDASQIASDVAGIFTDLAATPCSESAAIYGPDGITERGTVTILRGATLSGTRLMDSGFADLYSHSVYMLASTDVGVQVDDIITLSDGDFRVLKIHNGPLGVYMRLDLAGKWGDVA